MEGYIMTSKTFSSVENIRENFNNSSQTIEHFGGPLDDLEEIKSSINNIDNKVNKIDELIKIKEKFGNVEHFNFMSAFIPQNISSDISNYKSKLDSINKKLDLIMTKIN